METLGREREPRRFDPRLAARALAWLGALVFVLGTAGCVFLVTRDDAGVFGPGGASGWVYTAVTVEPLVVMATGILWAVAALLWTQSKRDET